MQKFKFKDLMFFKKEKDLNQRKYIKYEDGRIEYIIKENSNNTVSENEPNIYFNRKSFVNNIKKKIKCFKIDKFINGLLLAFLIISIVFIYFYYIKDISKPTNNNLVAKQNIKQEETLFDVTDFYNETINNLKDNYSKELNKINDYFDLKANRGSVLSLIEKNKKKKENIYVDLVRNKQYFKNNQDLYDELEYNLIKSIVFNEEIKLAIIKDLFTKSKFEEIKKEYISTDRTQKLFFIIKDIINNSLFFYNY